MQALHLQPSKGNSKRANSKRESLPRVSGQNSQAKGELTLSKAAIRRIESQLFERGSGAGVRLAVKPAGCSGLTYQMEFVDAPDRADLAFKAGEAAVYVDAKSMVYLNGVHLDYVSDGINEGFEFKNPNVAQNCGCGESFSPLPGVGENSDS